MSKRKPITFRHVPATGDPNAGTYRTSYWVHDASGIELRKGIDDGDGYPVIEWQIWTAGMGRPLTGPKATLPEAKAWVRDYLSKGGPA